MPRVSTTSGAVRRRPNNAAALDTLFKPQEGFRALPGFVMVKRENIILLPQIRQTLDDVEIRSMRENISQVRAQRIGSIEDTGILQPLLVTPIKEQPGFFLLQFGHKRFISTGDYDGLPVLLPELPCVAVEVGARKLVQLIENGTRSDVLPGDEALGVVEALKDIKMTQSQLATLLGQPLRWVENRVKLGRRLDPTNKREYQEDLALWLAVHAKKKSATLSNLLLLSGQHDPAVRRRLMRMMEVGTSFEAMEKVVLAAKPPEPDDAPQVITKRSLVVAAPTSDTRAGDQGTGTGARSGRVGEPGQGVKTAQAVFFGQAAQSQAGQLDGVRVPPSTEGGFEVKPVGGFGNSTLEEQTAHTEGTPAEDGSTPTGEVALLGDAPTPTTAPARALKDFVYPANEQLAVAARLLQNGELSHYTDAEMIAAVEATQRRYEALRALLIEKLAQEKDEA